MSYLFSYGTLKNELIQQKIFGRVLNKRHAVLEGFCIKGDIDGFYHLAPGSGFVPGMLLEVTKADLLRADQWEEVPVYEREEVIVMVDQKPQTAWVYFKDLITQEIPLGLTESPACLCKEELEALIDGFCSVRDEQLPFGDLYLLIPGEITNPLLYGKMAEFKSPIRDYFCEKIGWAAKSLGDMAVVYQDYPVKFNIYWLESDLRTGWFLCVMPVILGQPAFFLENFEKTLSEFSKKRGIAVIGKTRGHLFLCKIWRNSSGIQKYLMPELFNYDYRMRIEKEVACLSLVITKMIEDRRQTAKKKDFK